MAFSVSTNPTSGTADIRVNQFGTNEWCRATVEQTDRSININVTQSAPSRIRSMLGDLGRTQKRKRRSEIDNDMIIVTKRRKCSLSDLRLIVRPGAVDCIHLSTAQRETIRSIDEISIPSEHIHFGN